MKHEFLGEYVGYIVIINYFLLNNKGEIKNQPINFL
jgi:hypothetical protein